VAGFGLGATCAIASTVAHDSHNLLVLGTDSRCMAKAANRTVDMGGGLCLVRDEAVVAEIPLPVAGLMSEAPVAVVAEQVKAFHRALRDCGCAVADPLVTLSFLALPVIPQLRLTDRGLVDVDAFKTVPIFIEEERDRTDREG